MEKKKRLSLFWLLLIITTGTISAQYDYQESEYEDYDDYNEYIDETEIDSMDESWEEEYNYTPKSNMYDITNLTPDVNKCRISVDNNKIDFYVDTSNGNYEFEITDKDEMNNLLDHIYNESKSIDGEYVINAYIKFKILEDNYNRNYTNNTYPNNTQQSYSNQPQTIADQLSAQQNNYNQNQETSKEMTSLIEVLNSIDRNKLENILENVIILFVVLLLCKWAIKAISSNKKEEKDSSLDDAWFHDHNQKL